MAEGLFKMLSEKFNVKTIPSLQNCKLSRKSEEFMQEWMGRLQIRPAECKCRENGRRLKEQFIIDMTSEVITAK